MLRRLHLDLIGLPPSLDLARYADTNGYQADQFRTVWPYRDWVVNAMNADLPFDQFTIEQLAGDLLPGATVEQKIATGFHRLTTCNVEAGVDPEENRTNQIIDRVNTTGTVWLGTSIECMQCHAHKYDPFSQKEYYQLFAYFNNTPLEVEGNGVTFDFVGPKMDLPLPADAQARREQLEQELAAIDQQQSARLAALARDADRASLPDKIAKILALPPKKRTKKHDAELADYFLGQDLELKKLRERADAARKELDAVQPLTTLVMVEDQPRMTSLFKRGDFLNKGQSVAAGTPRALHQTKGDLPPNRLGFAQWLVDRDNPLVARVTVNRWWAEMFGQGIVATGEDFGAQGELPTHPHVLDFLAREFADHGWSMKHVQRMIVTSATYQQSSRVTDELRRRDPHNLLYARGPRFRLSAEIIRDNALSISGLISSNMSGPPIYPPQPDGIWRHVGRNEPKYDTSQGDNRFRRGVYVIWRRSAPYPSFTNFDAPDRASCVVSRPRTNTATQALTLLNDPAYLEMAAHLAARLAADHTNLTVREKVEYGFRLTVARQPTPTEVDHLEQVYLRESARFGADKKSAQQLLGAFLQPNIEPNDLAAWLIIANILLNLDESITKS